MKSIDAGQVAYFYADDKLVYLKTRQDERFLISQTLERLERELDPACFHRVNRKFIITHSAIREMHLYSKSRVKIDLSPACPEECIVSVDRASGFKQWLGN
ncbi:MAG: LytTR family transcriptional regulator [Cytophagales bacterium]|nr:LytTR family transcriptional regulator [Cytophagales bacterium]